MSSSSSSSWSSSSSSNPALIPIPTPWSSLTSTMYIPSISRYDPFPQSRFEVTRWSPIRLGSDWSPETGPDGSIQRRAFLLVGGWPTPSEKWWSESQLGLLWMITFPSEWKVIKHVPNHQPGFYFIYIHRETWSCFWWWGSSFYGMVTKWTKVAAAMGSFIGNGWSSIVL